VVELVEIVPFIIVCLAVGIALRSCTDVVGAIDRAITRAAERNGRLRMRRITPVERVRTHADIEGWVHERLHYTRGSSADRGVIAAIVTDLWEGRRLLERRFAGDRARYESSWKTLYDSTSEQVKELERRGAAYEDIRATLDARERLAFTEGLQNELRGITEHIQKTLRRLAPIELSIARPLARSREAHLFLPEPARALLASIDALLINAERTSSSRNDEGEHMAKSIAERYLPDTLAAYEHAKLENVFLAETLLVEQLQLIENAARGLARAGERTALMKRNGRFLTRRLVANPHDAGASHDS
jgi:hypothetical protein